MMVFLTNPCPKRPVASRQILSLFIASPRIDTANLAEFYARRRKEMPSIFCLSENHDEVAKFLLELRHDQTVGGERLQRLRMSGRLRKAQMRRGGVYESFIDFATMDRITPATALVLASEYDRANSLYDYGEGLRAINLETWKPEVRSTLQEVGFLPLLGIDPPREHLASHGGVYIVPFMSGSKVVGALIDDLILGLARFAEGRGVGDSETSAWAIPSVRRPW